MSHDCHLRCSALSARPVSGAVIESLASFCVRLSFIVLPLLLLTMLMLLLLLMIMVMMAMQLHERHRSHRTFRPSTAKKDIALQPLPLNLHYQLLSVRQHTHQRAASAEVINCVTCGAMTAHALGHKKGGLFYQEGKLVARRNELEWLKQCFGKHVVAGGGTRIPQMPPFAAFAALQHLGAQTLEYEEQCLRVARRRVLAVSQSLSVAVNAFLLKLSLAIEGQVEESTCATWLRTGFLLVFEGLLSVVGNERSMLEDTISAVDALRNYQIQIQLQTEQALGAQSAAPATEATKLRAAVDADASQMGSDRAAADPAGCPAGAEGIKMRMIGRVVILAVAPQCAEKLPPMLRSAATAGTAIIQIIPVLFTQVTCCCTAGCIYIHTFVCVYSFRNLLDMIIDAFAAAGNRYSANACDHIWWRFERQRAQRGFAATNKLESLLRHQRLLPSLSAHQLLLSAL